MQLGSSFYNEVIREFKFNIREIFGDSLLELNNYYDFDNMGRFILVYTYLPLNYKITIENEIRTFDITIEDEEGASNSLYRIEKFNNILNEKNIMDSLLLLQRILEKNKFNFYLHKDNKLYRKNADGLKRIKDIKELFNG